MHCQLIVPALLPQGEEAAAAMQDLRLPALEMLLARGRRTSDEAMSLEAWLAEAFEGDPEAEIPAGALTLSATGGTPADSAWMRADPAHLRLNRDQLVLVPALAFPIKPIEAEALVATLNSHFAGELTFYPVLADRWCVRVESPLAGELRMRTPIEVAGKDINRHLPTGDIATRWHALLNEMQMVLHEHEVNEAREARGEPVVNSVWLWGAGALPDDVAGPFQSVTADDPLAIGYAKAAGMRNRPVPRSAEEWLERLPEDGRQLLVLDALRLPFALSDLETWRTRVQEIDSIWCVPLIEALKAGRIGMVTIVVPDADSLLSVESTRNDLRHFWRRPKALASLL